MSKPTKQKLRNIHPGEVLREEFLLPLGISQYRLAKEIGVTEARISAICSGKRTVTADAALRLAAFFGTTSGFWLGLRADYDAEEAANLPGEMKTTVALNGGVGEDTWRRLSGSGAAWSFYRDNIEEEFAMNRVSGNGHREVTTPDNEARHARSVLLNPSPIPSPQSPPASKNLLDELFRKP